MRAHILPLTLPLTVPLSAGLMVALAACGKSKHHDVGVDLVATGATATPLAPTADDTITVAFNAENLGPNAVSTPIQWQVRTEDQVLGSGTVASLAAHGSAPGTASFHAPEPGSRTLYVTVDPNHLIAEDNDGDNDTAVPITVSATPPHFNLLFASAPTITPATPSSSDARVQFSIQNNDTTGSSLAAANVHWHIYDNGVSIGSNTIASIPANGTQNQSFLLTGTSGGTAGVHHLSIVIDPHHAIHESNEGDNTATFDAAITMNAGG